MMTTHQRAVAMRAAWCARQSPKAWPKTWGPEHVFYAKAVKKAEIELNAALFDDTSATFRVASND